MYSTYEGGFGAPVCEADPTDRAEGHHPRRRPEPHRPGDRVRLLLRPRRLRAARGRVRDHHGQLQPGDRQHRLRHLRPAVFRAADRRGRDRPVRSEQERGTLLGCIVQYGGQTPLKLRQALSARRDPDPRHLAPTRSTPPRTASGSSRCCTSLGLRQPDNGTARSAEEAEAIAERVGYPVVMRPSYVLGGRAMEIVLRPRRAAALHARGGARLRRQPGADRPLPQRRDRGRRRLHRRRRASTSPA